MKGKIAPMKFIPNERLQSSNELAKHSFSFTELAPCVQRLDRGHTLGRENMCAGGWIYLSSSKKHRLIIALIKISLL